MSEFLSLNISKNQRIEYILNATKNWKLISHDLFYGTFEYISICSFLEYLKIERMSLKNVIAANGYAVLFHKRRFSYFPLVQYKRDFLHKR
jgi:hypothetical protein